MVACTSHHLDWSDKLFPQLFARSSHIENTIVGNEPLDIRGGNSRSRDHDAQVCRSMRDIVGYSAGGVMVEP